MFNRGTRLGALALTLLIASALSAPVSAHAITRADVIKRANVWVKLKVPYSQSRYATVEGSLVPTSVPSPSTKGYRTDCSGFVAMSLALKTSTGTPLSLDTGSFPARLTKITKSQLLPGDVILRPKTLKIDGKTVPYGHAVLFGGWTDSSKTAYWGLHESSSAKGTVRVKIPWGNSGFYSALGFAPYRYAGVRDRIVVPRTFGR
jgi:hypothetical protein